jgi:hypothetical protein
VRRKPSAGGDRFAAGWPYHWRRNLCAFISRFRSAFLSLNLVGSLASSERPRPTSDVDAIAVIADLDAWRRACREFSPGGAPFGEDSARLYETGAARYLCLNFDFAGVPYSLDFVLPDFFRRARADLSRGETIIYQRVTDKPITDGDEFGCGSKRISPAKTNTRQGRCILVATPLCIVDRDFYLGLHLDKLLTGYHCLWGDDADVADFCAAGVQQLAGVSGLDSREAVRSLNRYARLSAAQILKQERFFQACAERDHREEQRGARWQRGQRWVPR